jgi:ATP-binding protein involved in chromosome partitioning
MIPTSLTSRIVRMKQVELVGEQGKDTEASGNGARVTGSDPGGLAADRVAPRSPGTEALWNALQAVVDPELGSDIVSLGMVRDVTVTNGVATVSIALTTAACPLRDQLRRDVAAAGERAPGISHVEIVMGAMDQDERSALMGRARRAAQDRALAIDLPMSTRVLGIVSGKGGVGKSSVSVNLAVALASQGATVGILDADIWGFSVPRMLGVEGPLEVRNKKMVPHERVVGSGLVKIVSMGFLSGEDDAIMWRGLMLNRAVQHFLEDVEWGDLDYLIVDMPPGTGDVQMGLARMVPRCELVIVTTPALGAQKVAGRAADMARRGHLRIAGVIENMAGFTADDGKSYAIFGAGGGQRLADEIGVPLICSIPIDPGVARGGDGGNPVALDHTSPLAKVFADLARTVRAQIAPTSNMESCSARLIDNVRQALTRADETASERLPSRA